MKIFGIVFSLLLTLISAAVFGGFPRGMFSAHKSFSKLMSDVVSNVRQNIDCSIRSMQSVLDKGSPIPYTSDSRCNEEANHRVASTNIKQHVKTAASDSIKLNKVQVEQNFTSTTQSPNTDGPLVNKTIINIITNQMAQNKLDEINNVLKNETDQLNNVNDLLKQKIDTISKDVNEGLKKIEQNHKEPRIEDVIHEIDLLREQKQNDSSKVDEVRKIAQEVLNKLNKNDTTSNDATSLKIAELMKTVTDLERYSNNTLKEMARQFKDWEAVESDQLYTIKNILERQQSSHENEKNNKPLNFKDISKNIFDGKPVYLNQTDSAMIVKEAESRNTSQIKNNNNMLVEVTTMNIITYDPISLSTSQVGSNIINISTVNNSTNLLTTEPYQTEKYSATKKNDTSEKDFSRNKNTETITSTEKGGTTDLLNAEHRTNLGIDTDQKLMAINSSILLDEGQYTSTASTLYINIQDNINDLVTSNTSDGTGNMSSVEKQAVTEIINKITHINDTIIPINISSNMGNITDVSNITNFVTEKMLSTYQYYPNYTNTTTESTYRSTDIVDISNNMNSSYNIDNEPEPYIASTIKSGISYVSSKDQLITTENYLSTDEINVKNDVANKAEPIIKEEMSTMLSVGKYEVTENSLPISDSEIDTTKIVENGSEFVKTSTPMVDTLDFLTTEHFDSTIIINQIDNYISTTTESVNPSAGTDYNLLVNRPGEEYLMTTENSFRNVIDVNHNILEGNESNNNSITYDDTTTGIMTVDNRTTDNIAETNHSVKSIDDTIERVQTSKTTNSLYDITDSLNVNNGVTIDIPISTNNLNPNIHSTTTENNVTPNYSRKDKISAKSYLDKAIELVTAPTSLDDMSNLLNVEKQTTTEYFLTSNLGSVDITTSTNFSPAFSSSKTDENSDDARDVLSVHIIETTVNNLAHKFNLSKGNEDTLEISSGEHLLTTENLISTTDVNSYSAIAEEIEKTRNISINMGFNVTNDIEMSSMEETVTSKKILATDRDSSNANVDNNINSLSTSTNAYSLDISRYVSSEMINPTTDLGEAVNVKTESYENLPNKLNLENQHTTKYYLTTNQVYVDFNIPTETVYTSTSIDSALTDVTDVPDTNILKTSENYYFTQNIYSKDNTVEKREFIDTSTYKSDTIDVSNEKVLHSSNSVEPFINLANDNEITDTSTNKNAIFNFADVVEYATSEKPYTTNEIKNNNNFNENGMAITSSTNAELLQTPNIEENWTTESNYDISDVLNVMHLETTEYYPTTNPMKIEFNNPTDVVYASITTKHPLLNGLDLSSLDILKTTEVYHSSDEINSNDDTVERSETIDTSKDKNGTINVSSENILHSTNRVKLFSRFSNENDFIDTSTNSIDYKNVVTISTPTNAVLIQTPDIMEIITTESSTSTIYSNNDVKQKMEILDNISEENLETTKNYSTPNEININFNNPTEAVYSSTTTDNVLVRLSDLPILESSEDLPPPDEINSNDDTVQQSEHMNTSTYKGDLMDVSSEEIPHSTNSMKLFNSLSNDNEFKDSTINTTDNNNLSDVKELGTSEKPPATTEMKISNSIYKSIVITSPPPDVELLQMPNTDEKLTTESSTSTIYSNDDKNQKTEPIDDISVRFSDDNLGTTEYNPITNQIYNTTETEFSSTTTTNVVITSDIISGTNILESTEDYNSPDEIYSNTDTVEKSEFVDSQIYKDDDTLDVSSEEVYITTEHIVSTSHNDVYDAIADEYDSIEASTSSEDTAKVTSERPYTMDEIHSNYDLSEENQSADSNTNDALEESKETNLITSSASKSIQFNNKHTESIETSTNTYGVPSAELSTPSTYYLSKEQLVTNTESTDVTSAEYRRLKNNSNNRATTEYPTSTICPDELKLLPKGKARDQAVKLALNIFEQSRRSQSIMKNVFKNEKFGTSLF